MPRGHFPVAPPPPPPPPPPPTSTSSWPISFPPGDSPHPAPQPLVITPDINPVSPMLRNDPTGHLILRLNRLNQKRNCPLIPLSNFFLFLPFFLSFFLSFFSPFSPPKQNGWDPGIIFPGMIKDHTDTTIPLTASREITAPSPT